MYAFFDGLSRLSVAVFLCVGTVFLCTSRGTVNVTEFGLVMSPLVVALLCILFVKLVSRFLLARKARLLRVLIARTHEELPDAPRQEYAKEARVLLSKAEKYTLREWQPFTGHAQDRQNWLNHGYGYVREARHILGLR